MKHKWYQEDDLNNESYCLTCRRRVSEFEDGLLDESCIDPRAEIFECTKHDFHSTIHTYCAFCENERLRRVLVMIGMGTEDEMPPFRCAPASVLKKMAKDALEVKRGG